MATYLDSILTAHRARVAADPRPLEGLIEEALQCPQPRGFARALSGGDRLHVISEIKRRSPSKGSLFVDLDAAQLARDYLAGGASCLSVLTDEEHFGGSATDLAQARAAVDLPVLRKDFTVDERDVCDARLMGADCVLLIVAALDDDELGRFARLAGRLGLDALLEVHDEDELARAVEATRDSTGSLVFGVNQRDLVTFEVDQDRAVRVAGAMPQGVVKVAESGVRGRADAEVLAAAGYDAVLVGEHLVTAEDPRRALDELRVPRPAAR